MTFEKIVKQVNKIIPIVWDEKEKYISREELHNRILTLLELPLEKQYKANFCRLLKGAIHATVNCKEVKIRGYYKYKRL